MARAVKCYGTIIECHNYLTSYLEYDIYIHTVSHQENLRNVQSKSSLKGKNKGLLSYFIFIFIVEFPFIHSSISYIHVIYNDD